MNMKKFLKTTLAIILITGAGIIAYNIQKADERKKRICHWENKRGKCGKVNF